MPKVSFVVEYSQDGETWEPRGESFPTLEAATAAAESFTEPYEDPDIRITRRSEQSVSLRVAEASIAWDAARKTGAPSDDLLGELTDAMDSDAVLVDVYANARARRADNAAATCDIDFRQDTEQCAVCGLFCDGFAGHDCAEMEGLPVAKTHVLDPLAKRTGRVSRGTIRRG